tara:strand:+ start:395 stop:1330 length:936 start_codon:yes stop_codon:yes gene_type:complete
MEYILHKILEARPTLRPITMKNYKHYLISIGKKVTQSEFKNLDFSKNFEKVNFFLDEYTFNTRRAITTSLVVALGALDDPYDNKSSYDKLLAQQRTEFNKNKLLKKPDKKVIDNWKTMSDLKKIQNKWRRKVNDDNIPNRDVLSKRSQEILQNYLIVSLYTLMPPRRLIYSDVELISTTNFKKLAKIQKEKNYLVFSKSLKKIFFWFGYQKSKQQSDEYALQKPNPRVRKILQLYLRFHRDRQWLLYNRLDRPMLHNNLGAQIKKLLGVGASMIRKIYITENTKQAHLMIDTIASKMGHSSQMAYDSYLQK